MVMEGSRMFRIALKMLFRDRAKYAMLVCGLGVGPEVDEIALAGLTALLTGILVLVCHLTLS